MVEYCGLSTASEVFLILTTQLYSCLCNYDVILGVRRGGGMKYGPVIVSTLIRVRALITKKVKVRHMFYRPQATLTSDDLES